MALLLIFAALLSCSAAQYYQGYSGYAGFPHGHSAHGVYAHGPVDTPEVQAAKAAHFSAHAEAAARNGAHPTVVAHGHLAHGAAHGHLAHGAAHGHLAHGPAYAPQHLGYHPVPVQDTPEVAAAKAQHFHAYNKAAAAAAAAPDTDIHYDGHHDAHRAAHGVHHAAHGVHHAAHGVHHAAHGVHHGVHQAAAHHGFASHGAAFPHHPVYAAGYQPLPVHDTPEVQAAKAAHFAAHAEARARAH